MVIKYQNLELVKSLYVDSKINIIEIVDSYADPVLYKKILSNSYSWSSNDTRKLNDLLKNTTHHSDFRNNKEYAFNIIINWLVEDLVYNILSRDYEVSKIGSDHNRQLLNGKNINSEPDILISSKGNIWIEVITNYPIKNYSSFWEKESYFDLRDNKMNTLLKKCNKDKVMIVGIIVKKMEFFCMEIKSNTKFDKVESVSNFGFKKSCRIHFAKKIVSYPISNLNKIVNY